jgi:GMP synthase-like glutamine amidotransferase
MNSPLRICSLEHAAEEGAGKIAEWAQRRGHNFQAIRLDLGERLPPVGALDFLVIMGGAMNVYQYRDYPWLAAERDLIGAAVAARKAVLGVCLGAQLIADVLGARVVQNAEREIGWFPIRQTAPHPLFAGFPTEYTAFSWHGDTFGIPPESLRVAESDACANQAFVHGDRVVGLQFHVEVTPAAVRGFVAGGESALVEGRYVQSAEVLRMCEPDLEQTDRGLEMLLDGLAVTMGAQRAPS